jgi:hypothetical protein
VHEQGTANVDVTNASLSVTPKVATAVHFKFLNADAGHQADDHSFSINASMVTITSLGGVSAGVSEVQLRSGGNTIFDESFEPGGDDFIDLPFTQLVPIDEVILFCEEGVCAIDVSVIGN